MDSISRPALIGAKNGIIREKNRKLFHLQYLLEAIWPNMAYTEIYAEMAKHEIYLSLRHEHEKMVLCKLN